MFLDIILVALLAAVVAGMFMNRAIKIEIKHISEIVNRTVYVDETPHPKNEPLSKVEQDAMDEFYKNQTDPIQEVMNMIHNIGGETHGRKQD